MEKDDYRDGHDPHQQLTDITVIMAHIRRMGHTFLAGMGDPGVADMGVGPLARDAAGGSPST
jgi:hypothetical protein